MQAAREQGHEVSVFLMYDGVYNVHKKEFAALVDSGVSIALCAMNAEQRKVGKVDRILSAASTTMPVSQATWTDFISFG